MCIVACVRGVPASYCTCRACAAVTRERVCCLLVLNLVSSTLPCIRRPRPRLGLETKHHRGLAVSQLRGRSGIDEERDRERDWGRENEQEREMQMDLERGRGGGGCQCPPPHHRTPPFRHPGMPLQCSPSKQHIAALPPPLQSMPPPAHASRLPPGAPRGGRGRFTQKIAGSGVTLLAKSKAWSESKLGRAGQWSARFSF